MGQRQTWYAPVVNIVKDRVFRHRLIGGTNVSKMINGLLIQGLIVILIKWKSSLQKEAIKKSNNNSKQIRNEYK